MAPALGLVALLLAVGLIAVRSRAPSAPSAPELLSYQAPASGLPAAERARHEQIRAAIRTAETARARTGQWPTAFEVPGLQWAQARHGPYVNYVGVPADPTALRWLVLFIEPEPSAIKDPAPAEDDEHHTLADGTALHVTAWTAKNEGPVPQVVIPFPAAENWTQQLPN